MSGKWCPLVRMYKTAFIRFRLKMIPLCGGGNRFLAEGFGYGFMADFLPQLKPPTIFEREAIEMLVHEGRSEDSARQIVYGVTRVR